MNLSIRPETRDDLDAIRQVNRAAFGREEEAALVDALRSGGFVRLSLVAELEQEVVGHILFSDLPIVTATGSVAALALAPLAVVPASQNRGIGTALVEQGLATCRVAGHQIVIVVGHPQYYPRFGFAAALAAQLDSPFPGDAFMALELMPGAMKGVLGRVMYPAPFGAWT